MTDPVAWRPVASRAALESRARQLAYVRGFFAQRGVLEVETPVLGRHGVTDPHLDSVAVSATTPEWSGGVLQTSPEYHMKRLLAAGSGPIYQVARVFRDGERGRRHNVEFSLLEWYRPGFDDQSLMSEVADLVTGWLHCDRPDTLSYRDALRAFGGVDPFEASLETLRDRCRQWMAPEQLADLGRDGCLDLIMSLAVEPQLGQLRPVFITRYPASQAALAKVSQEDGHPVAHRFELYVRGVELCNGYWELTDPDEQARRFAADNQVRKALNKPVMTVDEALLAALSAGLPECAGVAMGLDRLLMLKTGAEDIAEVLAFPVERA
ncbi:EF-P lysine aminoacylase EpmA [Marinobacter sp. C2H3]|uniref:EF-P lysine aminoacylase EpmA n=1 Tax=Marinobacter sp. C2H3 TaxID=3119003 RepID=UPI00300F6EDE